MSKDGMPHEWLFYPAFFGQVNFPLKLATHLSCFAIALAPRIGIDSTLFMFLVCHRSQDLHILVNNFLLPAMVGSLPSNNSE